jgi:hypothetical protein
LTLTSNKVLSRKLGKGSVSCDGKYLGFYCIGHCVMIQIFSAFLYLMGAVFVTDMSSTAFIEPKTVMEFIRDLLNRDLSRGLSDADRIKVCHQNEVSGPMVCQTRLQLGQSEQSLSSDSASACDPTSLNLTLGIPV